MVYNTPVLKIVLLAIVSFSLANCTIYREKRFVPVNEGYPKIDDIEIRPNVFVYSYYWAASQSRIDSLTGYIVELVPFVREKKDKYPPRFYGKKIIPKKEEVNDSTRLMLDSLCIEFKTEEGERIISLDQRTVSVDRQIIKLAFTHDSDGYKFGTVDDRIEIPNEVDRLLLSFNAKLIHVNSGLVMKRRSFRVALKRRERGIPFLLME